MRLSVLWAVAWRDLRRVVSGRKRYSLPLTAALLLLPAGALPLGGGPEAPLAPPPLPAIQGDVPAGLEGSLRVLPAAPAVVDAGPPVVVSTPQLSPRLRAALDGLEAERPPVVVRAHRPPVSLPYRSLLVALVAISLLTGPLAESLPGEREEGTFETLLAAALSHRELIVGKWLAWTLAASGAALLSSASGWATGTQPAGWWLVGLPLSLSVAVAVGLWLVRQAGDVIGGAAAPMRVIPSLAVFSVVVAWLAAQVHPLLGMALPLGGALLLTGGLHGGLLSVLVCFATTALTVGVLLHLTARDLQRPLRRASLSAAALLVGTAVSWWLPVAAPAAWSLAGRGDLVDPQAGLRGGALLFLLLAGVVAARDTRPAGWRRPDGLGVLWAVAVGGALALVSNLPSAILTGGALATRLLAQPETLLGALLLACGGEALFRGVLLRRLGTWPALLAWIVIVFPLDPLQGLVSGAALGWLAKKHGVTAAIIGALLWHMS